MDNKATRGELGQADWCRRSVQKKAAMVLKVPGVYLHEDMHGKRKIGKERRGGKEGRGGKGREGGKGNKGG
jgi:hypothetical protein